MILWCDDLVKEYIRTHPDDEVVKAFFETLENCKFHTTEQSFAIFSLVAQRLCRETGGQIECKVERTPEGKIVQMTYLQEGNA